MVENVQLVRWRTVERMNGFTATWWRYNRVTLALLLWIISGLMWAVYIERSKRVEAEADTVILAQAPNMACYNKERSTSLIIAGGSQQVVDNALRQAAYQIDEVRGVWIAARSRAIKRVNP